MDQAAAHGAVFVDPASCRRESRHQRMLQYDALPNLRYSCAVHGMLIVVR